MTQEVIFKSPKYCLIVWLRQKKHKVLQVQFLPREAGTLVKRHKANKYKQKEHKSKGRELPGVRGVGARPLNRSVSFPLPQMLTDAVHRANIPKIV